MEGRADTLFGFTACGTKKCEECSVNGNCETQKIIYKFGENKQMEKISFEGIKMVLEQESKKLEVMEVPHIFLYRQHSEANSWKIFEHGTGLDIVSAFAVAILAFSRDSGFGTDEILQGIREMIDAISQR